MNRDVKFFQFNFGTGAFEIKATRDFFVGLVNCVAQLDRIGEVDNDRARHLHAILPYYRRFALEASGLDGIHVHDSTTISWLVAPRHFTSVDHPVRVDTGHGVGRGKTWARTRPAQHGDDPWAGRRPVTILTGADVDAVVALELGRLGVDGPMTH